VQLFDVEPGKRIKVLSITGGRAVKSRLASMGLIPGVELIVVRSGLYGACIVSLKGNNIILGRGIAYKVDVEEAH
jgi:ferrous iron transport protein A